MSTHPIDAVNLSIMWDRLVGITDEIISALVRSSFSTIVRESGDLSVVVLDAEGNSMAQGSYSVPSFTGTAAPTLRPHAREVPGGHPGTGRRRGHQRRLDGHPATSSTST